MPSKRASGNQRSVCDPGHARLSHLAVVLALVILARPFTIGAVAAAEGFPEKLKVFVNCALGECWSPPALEVPEAEVLMARAEPHPDGVVPAGAALLTRGRRCTAGQDWRWRSWRGAATLKAGPSPTSGDQ